MYCRRPNNELIVDNNHNFNLAFWKWRESENWSTLLEPKGQTVLSLPFDISPTFYHFFFCTSKIKSARSHTQTLVSNQSPWLLLLPLRATPYTWVIQVSFPKLLVNNLNKNYQRNNTNQHLTPTTATTKNYQHNDNTNQHHHTNYRNYNNQSW